MHPLTASVTVVYILLAAAMIGLGVLGLAPLLDRMPPARLGLLVLLWAAVFLGMPALWAGLDGYIGDARHSYLSEMGHCWPAYTPCLSALLVSCVRRWRRGGWRRA